MFVGEIVTMLVEIVRILGGVCLRDLKPHKKVKKNAGFN